MNKYLLLSAAALTASSSAASAKGDSGLITFDGFCDGLSITEVSKGLFASTHDFTNCGFTQFAAGLGVEGKSKGIGKNVALSDSYDDSIGYFLTYDVQLPLVSGNEWIGYLTYDGVTVVNFGGGTYTVAGTPHQAPRGTKTTFSDYAAKHNIPLKHVAK